MKKYQGIIKAWRKFREALKKQMPQQSAAVRCLWLENSTHLPIPKCKVVSVYIKLKTVVPWVGSVVSKVSHKLSRIWLYHSKIYVFIF